MVAGGGRHSASCTRSGHVFTWGDDTQRQLGHGYGVSQRMPALLTTIMRTQRVARRFGWNELVKVRVDDVRDVGCGHDFTAALTWSGEVYVWGKLGGKTFRLQTLVERLRGAAVSSMAVGQGHIVMLTGSLTDRERIEEIGQKQREEAGERLNEVVSKQQAKLAQEKAKMAASIAEARDAKRNEKKRVQLIKRLAAARARLRPRERPKRDENGDIIQEGEGENPDTAAQQSRGRKR